MSELDPKKFHKLYGKKTPRISFQSRDFIDYLVMIAICVTLLFFVYGLTHPFFILGASFGVALVWLFILRHGFSVRVPVIVSKPSESAQMVWYKIENLKPIYFVAIAVFTIEQFVIRLTPGLPHHLETMSKVAFYLFYIHSGIIFLYRTVILGSHLLKADHVKEVLLETSWRGIFKANGSPVVHILHAYITGMFTHIIFLLPWFFIISHFNFSLILTPVTIIVNVIVHVRYMKGYNAWFYRDHWLGHNSETDFLYLHGMHHDAIPSGLIGVSGNGALEGFFRHTLGNPMPIYNPMAAFLLYTIEVQQDIKYHQYIPGVFPRLDRDFHEWSQHSTHHFGRLAPYSIAFKDAKFGGKSGSNSIFPPIEILNSVELDEKLNGFKWDNPRYQHYLSLVDRFGK